MEKDIMLLQYSSGMFFELACLLLYSPCAHEHEISFNHDKNS